MKIGYLGLKTVENLLDLSQGKNTFVFLPIVALKYDHFSELI